MFFILLNGIVSAKALECPRAENYLSPSEENKAEWCNSNRFSEGGNTLFEEEVTAFQKKSLTPLLQDNIHDMKWLVRKSTQDLREHAFCVELICKAIQTNCSNIANTDENSQSNWCNTRIENFGKIEQLKTREVLIENQKRKSQANLREKMRAIEVRTLGLFIPQLQKFFSEYRFFTEKVPTFLSNPL